MSLKKTKKPQPKQTTKNLSEKICKSLGLFGIQVLWLIKSYTHLLAKVHITAPSGKLRSSCFERDLDSSEPAFWPAKDEDIQPCHFPSGSGISNEWRSSAIPALTSFDSNGQLGSWEFQVLGKLTKAKTSFWTNAFSRTRGKRKHYPQQNVLNKQKKQPIGFSKTEVSKSHLDECTEDQSMKPKSHI